jgi:CheY-like chemotaxis protein
MLLKDLLIPIICFFAVILPTSVITFLIHKMIEDGFKKLDSYKTEIADSLEKQLLGIKDNLDLRFNFFERRIDSLEENNKKSCNFIKQAKKISCLIVDDNQHQRNFIKEFLMFNFSEYNLFICEASTYDEAIQLIQSREFDIAIIDYCLNDKTGIDIIKYCKDNNKLVDNIDGVFLYKIILYTSFENLQGLVNLPIGIENCILIKNNSNIGFNKLKSKVSSILTI